MISLLQRKNLAYTFIVFSFLWEDTISFQIHNDKIFQRNHNIRAGDSYRFNLQSTQLSTSESGSFQKKSKTTTQRKPSYKKAPGRRGGLAKQSRSILTLFEQSCLREGKSIKKNDYVRVLDSMVHDLLEGKITQNFTPSDLKNASINAKVQNLSLKILPRDASSLIRLLGRYGALGSMLQFCRRYCKDISDIALQSSGDEVLGDQSFITHRKLKMLFCMHTRLRSLLARNLLLAPYNLEKEKIWRMSRNIDRKNSSFRFYTRWRMDISAAKIIFDRTRTRLQQFCLGLMED